MGRNGGRDDLWAGGDSGVDRSAVRVCSVADPAGDRAVETDLLRCGMKWEILVAGPAGYVRKEMFYGDTIQDALDRVLEQRFVTVLDEDGEVVAKPVGAANASAGG